MTLSCPLCHCFTGCLGCCLFVEPLSAWFAVSVVVCLSALIAAVIRAGQECRAPGLPWHCPPASLLAPSAFGEEPFGLNHSQQQSVTCLKLLFCRQHAHFPCTLWLCKLCAHSAHWVWCHGFQREAWLFAQSHFLHVCCGLLHHLIWKHILYSFVNNLIIHIYFDTVPFCPSFFQV